MHKLIAVAIFLVAVSASATVILPVGAAPQVLIPAAGSTAGANGTFFQSDITLINLASHDQQVSMQWLPQGTTGAGIAPKVYTIPARTGVRSADFVRTYLSQVGLGAIIMKGVTNTGQLDTSALLYVSSRIWTPEPGTAGTSSQTFPVIPLDSVNTPAAALFSLGAIVNPDKYRVNIGIVNVDPVNAQTFAIAVPTTSPAPPTIMITVQPMSMQQIPIDVGATSTGLPEVTITNMTSAMRSNLWTAYGSTIDNITGDAWSELAVAGTAP